MTHKAKWGEFLSEVAPLVVAKKIHFEETVTDGFENLPKALVGLFTGANLGKAVVKI
jgi:NADPH-dependent curcumin reductase CurA